jgi:hypothetical protein
MTACALAQPGEARSARANATLALDEPIQRLGIRRRVTHDPAPFGPRPFVSLGRVGGAPDDGGERVFPIRHFQPLQAQCPASPVEVADSGCLIVYRGATSKGLTGS